MARKFKTVDYEQSGQQKITIDDCLPADHLARFVSGDVGFEPVIGIIKELKKCWASGNSPYAAWRPRRESEVWSVWPGT